MHIHSLNMKMKLFQPLDGVQIITTINVYNIESTVIDLA